MFNVNKNNNIEIKLKVDEKIILYLLVMIAVIDEEELSDLSKDLI